MMEGYSGVFSCLPWPLNFQTHTWDYPAPADLHKVASYYHVC